MRFTRKAVAPVARRLVPRTGPRAAALILAGSRSLGVVEPASRALVREAERRLAAGQPARSREILAVLARRPPRGVPVVLRILWLLRRSGAPAQAAALGAALLDRSDLTAGQRARALSERARAEKRTGDLAAAVDHLAAAVAAAPHRKTWRHTLAGWQYQLGRAAERSERWETAAAAYRSAVEQDSTRASWHYRLGLMLERTGRWEPAATAYEQALLRDAGHPGWHERLARAVARAPEWTQSQPLPAGPAAGAVDPLPTRAISGWVPDVGDPLVRFTLNGTEIAQARAARQAAVAGGQRYLEFRRNLQDLWSYGGAGDILEIVHAGQPLHIVDRGRQFRFTGRVSRAGELLAKLADGQLFNKYGRVQKSIQLDHEWQSTMFELYARLRKELAEGFDVEVFPFYGTMLGAVREQDFIGHDNDFDTVYISTHSEPAAVRDEFRRICGFLLDRGYAQEVQTTHTRVYIPQTKDKLDIFFAWFDQDGYFQVSYGYHGEAIRRSEDFFESRLERLGTLEIPVPRNAEAILAQLYGTGWREPDPGFTHYARGRVLHREFHLGVSEANEAHWRQFYRDRAVDGASSFAQSVVDRLPATATVLDFGCGSGRDTIYFAQSGRAAVGADLSREAIDRAREASRRAGADRARFEVLDLASQPDVAGLVATHVPPSAGSEDVVVYLRFILHSVDESTEDVLLGALAGALPAGFRLCAEFRTVHDGDLPKAYGDHHRRYLDEQRFAAKLRDRWGFEIEHLEAGRGLSPYRGEDPHLARVIARWGRPTPG